MKISLGTLLAGACCFSAVALWAGQDAGEPPAISNEEQYRERMQEIDHAFADLENDRRTGLGSQSEEEAERLSALFEQVEAFWKGRGNELAAGSARMAREGAEAARDAARKKESKSFDAAVETLAASCEGCHDEPLDKYRLR